MKANKKGNIEIIIYTAVILFILLFVGFGLAIGAAVIDWWADETIPELTSIGTVGNANVTEYATYALTPVNTVIQSFTWLSGVLYAIALIVVLALAFAFRFTGNKWLVAFFILVMFMLIIASIFMSNIYEEYYQDSGDLGTRLKEQAMLSWFILYSPMVMSILGFVAGIIMFTGEGGEQVI